MVICVGKTVVDRMFDFSIGCFANCTHDVNRALKKSLA